MITTSLISQEFDSERRKKALLYTIMICGGLLLMFFLISWKTLPPPPPPLEQLIEVNLGNNEEGFGEVQPLKKGKGGPVENIPDPAPAASRPEETYKVTPDDNAEEKAAPVERPVKTTSKVKTVLPVVATVPKPPKPKITMPGTNNKNVGNNDTEDNWQKTHGVTPGTGGDPGDPKGNKDSYGNSPGGKIGGPLVRGNRKIIRHYAFTGDLKKATIYALVRVSPEGIGTFYKFDKGSTIQAPEYKQAIVNYLRNIQFDKSSQESTVQVQFNFKEN